MFTIHPQLNMKGEKHSLPPLSQIINNVIPFPQGQNQQHPQQPQHQQQPPQPHPMGPFNHQGQPLTYQVTSPQMTAPSQNYTNTKVASLSKCSCKQEGNHIPRPRNAFILFRQQHHQSVLDEGDSVKTNPDVSRELGKRWRDLSPNEKEYWNKLAEEEKKRHAEKYPGYRYIPRRFGKKGKCPTCKSRAHIKELDAHEQRLRILDLQEEELKAKLASFRNQDPPNGSSNQLTRHFPIPSQPPSLSNSSSTTPDDSRKFQNLPSSEEHAIAQSFLSLRNQTQHYYPQQPPVQQLPSQMPQQGQFQQMEIPVNRKDELPRLDIPTRTSTATSPSLQLSAEGSHKSCSIASFLN